VGARLASGSTLSSYEAASRLAQPGASGQWISTRLKHAALFAIPFFYGRAPCARTSRWLSVFSEGSMKGANLTSLSASAHPSGSARAAATPRWPAWAPGRALAPTVRTKRNPPPSPTPRRATPTEAREVGTPADARRRRLRQMTHDSPGDASPTRVGLAARPPAPFKRSRPRVLHNAGRGATRSSRRYRLALTNCRRRACVASEVRVTTCVRSARARPGRAFHSAVCVALSVLGTINHVKTRRRMIHRRSKSAFETLEERIRQYECALRNSYRRE